MSKRAIPSILASSPEEYRRLGLDKDRIEQWEDGLRTTGKKGTYEWWYFDAHLADGSKTVIVFYTKPLVDVDKPLAPYVAITLDRPDGSHIEKEYHAPPRAFSSASERCDVTIGNNTFQGDLHTYTIHVQIDEIVCDLSLTGATPPWRPATGYLLFGERSQHYFAWLPAVPHGNVVGTLTLSGNSQDFTGSGYHDHNWGNISPVRLMNHWYWARGKIGDYTLIASYITAEKRYGYKTFPVFMLARNGQIIPTDHNNVSFTAADIQADSETGKPIANITVYDYKDGNTRYLLTFEHKRPSFA